MKFNRKQESFLIELGLMRVLMDAMPRIESRKKKKNKKSIGRKWTRIQREKYARTMEKKWGQKK